MVRNPDDHRYGEHLSISEPLYKMISVAASVGCNYQNGLGLQGKAAKGCKRAKSRHWWGLGFKLGGYRMSAGQSELS